MGLKGRGFLINKKTGKEHQTGIKRKKR